MAVFKSLLAVAFALVATASAAPQLESRQTLGPLQWSYIGCWSDNPAARTLKAASFTDATGMTVDSCQTFCNNRHFNLAGVEFAQVNTHSNYPLLIFITDINPLCDALIILSYRSAIVVMPWTTALRSSFPPTAARPALETASRTVEDPVRWVYTACKPNFNFFI
ncbi:hypothetical protein D9619_009976 [Psilocybe cf. subviscida]|uniref:WSC domain-containing protein n=1 Tax=Psilocybe cf. subviscida TaxID=2480587 RepID=A0A8H5F6C7_9AGAR|nr:hypothetical protein D9619_009976 [Psilocybe cf. subviscida]